MLPTVAAAAGSASGATPTAGGAAGDGASNDATATAPTDAAADDAAKRAAAVVAEATLRQATEEATAALRLQKSLVVEIHHRFEKAYIAHRGARAMRESASNAATSKADMVDEATRNTLLDESEYSTFDPDSLPSAPAALKGLTDTQGELRVALTKYDASPKAAGLDGDGAVYLRAAEDVMIEFH